MAPLFGSETKGCPGLFVLMFLNYPEGIKIACKDRPSPSFETPHPREVVVDLAAYSQRLDAFPIPSLGTFFEFHRNLDHFAFTDDCYQDGLAWLAAAQTF
jgi:hypothetical protein